MLKWIIRIGNINGYIYGQEHFAYLSSHIPPHKIIHSDSNYKIVLSIRVAEEPLV